MYYVYILRSEIDGRSYIGHTADLKARLVKHNKGEVPSTRNRRPLNLIASVGCGTKKAAMKIEAKLKSFRNIKYATNWVRNPKGPLAQLVRASGS